MITWADLHAKCTAPEPNTPAEPAVKSGEGVEPATPPDAKSPLATRLEAVCGKAVDKLDAIMELPLDPTHPSFGSVLRAQTTAANTALSTQSRVDDMALRRAAIDRLPEILKLVAQIEKRLPPGGPIDLEANYGVTDDG